MYYHPPTLATNSSLLELAQGGALLAGNCSAVATAGLTLGSSVPVSSSLIHCTRERPLLCLLLMMGTLWMGYTLYQFKRRYYWAGSVVRSKVVPEQ